MHITSGTDPFAPPDFDSGLYSRYATSSSSLPIFFPAFPDNGALMHLQEGRPGRDALRVQTHARAGPAHALLPR